MIEQPDGGVVIALIQQRLDSWEQKIDRVIDDHERRLRAMERWMFALPVAALVAIGSMIAAVISALRA